MERPGGRGRVPLPQPRVAFLPGKPAPATGVPLRSADLSPPGRDFRRTVHETIRRVTTDIEEFRFNTAISALHELVNAMHAFATESLDRASAAERASLLAEGVETLVLLLAPFAPHLAEELWEQLGHRDSVFRASWPAADPAALERDVVQVVVQVDGRVRTRLVVPPEIAEDRLRTEALADEKVRPWLETREVARVVVVPGRLVNIVTRGTREVGMTRRDVLAFLLAPLASIALGGCGYSFRTSLPPGIQSIHVPVLENRTQEPGIEDFMTQALTQAVIQSGRVRLARNAQDADAVLEGAVVEYRLNAISFDRSANVTSYRLIIGLSLVFKDLKQNQILWKQDRIEERADFLVAGQVTQTLAREEAAVQRAAVEVARAIVSFAFEGF